MSRSQHITLVLKELHWLPIQHRIIFKILLLVCKSLNGSSSSYLAQKLNYRSHTRSSRSVNNELLMKPVDRLLKPMGTEHSWFMHQENATKYPMKLV